nr:glucokinase [uncultured bacterium]
MKTLGIDLGGTKIAAAVVDDGKVLKESIVPTPQTGFDAVLAAMSKLAESLLRDFPEVERVGVGSPGPLDLKEGTVLFAPNIPGMTDAPIVEGLKQALAKEVVLENDANAAGYAEHLYGAATDLETSIFITISTGIGGGLFIGDQVIHGAHSIAGEIGHMIVQLHGPLDGDGHYGTLESIAAGRAIARDASYSYGQAMDTREVFSRAQDGERKALKIIDNAALFTGIGIANLHKIFNPEGFVIGGGMSQVGRFYLDKIQAAVELYCEGYPPVILREAKLGTEAGVIGAASVALKL